LIKSWELTSKSFKAKMIGKLLGDGCITKQKGRQPRFQFNMYSNYLIVNSVMII